MNRFAIFSSLFFLGTVNLLYNRQVETDKKIKKLLYKVSYLETVLKTPKQKKVDKNQYDILDDILVIDTDDLIRQSNQSLNNSQYEI
jgi:hypothetical protein